MVVDPRPDYEAFLPEHHSGGHRVVGVTNTGRHAEVLTVTTVGDATAATRLADALNSRLLARRNHVARLDAALAGLPGEVRAAALRIPAGRPDADDLLAAYLAADPIDGLLLFRHGEHTAAGRDLTPRGAHVLALTADLLADACHDLITSTATSIAGEPALADLVEGWTPDRVHHLATALEGIADHLRAGLRPLPSTVTDQVALHLAADRGRTLPVQRPDLLHGRHLLLPAHYHDGTAPDTLSDLWADVHSLTDGAR